MLVGKEAEEGLNEGQIKTTSRQGLACTGSRDVLQIKLNCENTPRQRRGAPSSGTTNWTRFTHGSGPLDFDTTSSYKGISGIGRLIQGPRAHCFESVTGS